MRRPRNRLRETRSGLRSNGANRVYYCVVGDKYMASGSNEFGSANYEIEAVKQCEMRNM